MKKSKKPVKPKTNNAQTTGSKYPTKGSRPRQVRPSDGFHINAPWPSAGGIRYPSQVVKLTSASSSMKEKEEREIEKSKSVKSKEQRKKQEKNTLNKRKNKVENKKDSKSKGKKIQESGKKSKKGKKKNKNRKNNLVSKLNKGAGKFVEILAEGARNGTKKIAQREGRQKDKTKKIVTDMLEGGAETVKNIKKKGLIKGGIELFGTILENGKEDVKKIVKKGPKVAEGGMELFANMLEYGVDGVRKIKEKGPKAIEGGMELFATMLEIGAGGVKKLKDKGPKILEGGMELFSNILKNNVDAVKWLKDKGKKAIEGANEFFGTIKEKSKKGMEWFNKNVGSYVLGGTAGLADYAIARGTGAMAMGAQVFDGINSLFGLRTDFSDPYKKLGTLSSALVTEKLSGLASNKEAYYNTKYMANVIGEAELEAESKFAMGAALAALTFGGGSMALAPVTGGVTAVPGTASLVGAIVLGVDALWAGSSASMMSSIRNASGEKAREAGKDKKTNTTESPALKNSPYNPDIVNGRIKPEYKPNPAHNTKSPLFNPKKTPEPMDAKSVYNNSVKGGMDEWYGVNSSGEIYQFFYDNNGGVHFAGTISKEMLAKKNSAVNKLLGISMKGK